MTRPARKRLATALVLAVVVSVIWDRIPLGDASARTARLPKQGLGFASRDLPLSEVERGIFGDARVTKRLYRVRHDGLVITIIDGSRNRHAVHDPTYCFRGAGWSIEARSSLPIPGGEAAWMRLRRGQETREAVFWITDGRTRHASTARGWAQTVLRRLTLGASGPEPVLVILQPWELARIDWDRLPDRLPGLFAF